MSEFISMGGYAFYIWTSYALTFLVLTINIVFSYLKHRKTLREIAHFHQMKKTITHEQKT